MYVGGDTQKTITYHSYTGSGAYCYAMSGSEPIAVVTPQPIGTIPAATPAPLRIG